MSIRYTEHLNEAGIHPPVGSTGDAYDNALAETINGLYKTEVIRKRGPWQTKAAVELAIVTPSGIMNIAITCSCLLFWRVFG